MILTTDRVTAVDPADVPSPPDALAFADLVGRAGAGQPEAFDALAKQYEAKVRLVARVMLGRQLRPYVDSVDLLQSVHHSVLIGLRKGAFDISDPDKLTALAVTIVRRKVARHWRRVQRQQRVSVMTRPASTDAPDLFAAVEGHERGPGDAAQSRDQVERLCRDLVGLDRDIVELRLEGLSPTDIAGRLGITPITLRVRLTRLRQRLRKEHVAGEWL